MYIGINKLTKFDTSASDHNSLDAFRIQQEVAHTDMHLTSH